MSEQTTAARVPLPSVSHTRTTLGILAELWLGGLFLKPAAYNYQRDRKNPFAHGLLFIIIVGVLIALAVILGAGLRYATRPDAAAIQSIVLSHLQQMPFYTNAPASFHTQFDQTYARIWSQFGSTFMGYPTSANTLVQLLAQVLTTPLGLIISWLVYGALVWLVAHRWNHETSFGQLLGTLSLAAAPQLFYVLDLLPNVSIGAPVVLLWTFICNVFAIRIAYHTTTRRAVWGAVFPLLVYLVLAVLAGALGLAALLAAVQTMGAAQ